MVTTRRQSHSHETPIELDGPSTTHHDSITASRRALRSTSVASSSSTPVPAHHRRTAEDLARAESVELVGTPQNLMDESADLSQTMSPRDLRHFRLNQARIAKLDEERKQREGSQATQVTEHDEVASQASHAGPSVSKGAGKANHPSVAAEKRGARRVSHKDSAAATSSTVLKTVKGGVAGDDADQIAESSAGPSHTAESIVNGGLGAAEDALEDDEDISSSGSSSDDTSSSEDDSEDSTDGTSDESESDRNSEEEEEHLRKLLEAAKLSAKAKGKRKDTTGDAGERANDNDGEMVLNFDPQDSEDAKKEAPIPDIKIGKLPQPYLLYQSDGSAKAMEPRKQESAGAGNGRFHGSLESKQKSLELDDRPYEKQLSKREKAAMPRKATVSETWATLPAPNRDVLPQMKRDYQALALANSLDPKRFMKGSTKLNKVPELFAIGHVVDQPKHLRDTTLTRDTTYRPGQIVQGLVKDQSTGDYAKRKYGDLQWSRMENGRGKGWKKRSKW